MNQKEWYEYLRNVKRKQFLELEELKERHRKEIRDIELLMEGAEPTEDFAFYVMRSVDCAAMTVNDQYELAA